MSVKLPLDEMQSQVFRVCSDHLISIVFLKSHGKAFADEDNRIIHIYPIKSSISYCVALHEAGHLLSSRAKAYGLGGLGGLAKEAHAWSWALRHAILWNDTMERHKDNCLTSYLADAYDKGLKVPKKHFIWKVYKGE